LLLSNHSPFPPSTGALKTNFEEPRFDGNLFAPPSSSFFFFFGPCGYTTGSSFLAAMHWAPKSLITHFPVSGRLVTSRAPPAPTNPFPPYILLFSQPLPGLFPSFYFFSYLPFLVFTSRRYFNWALSANNGPIYVPTSFLLLTSFPLTVTLLQYNLCLTWTAVFLFRCPRPFASHLPLFSLLDSVLPQTIIVSPSYFRSLTCYRSLFSFLPP